MPARTSFIVPTPSLLLPPLLLLLLLLALLTASSSAGTVSPPPTRYNCSCNTTSSAATARFSIHVLVMAPKNPRYPFALDKVMPAVCLGIREVERRHLIPNVHLDAVCVDTNCTVDKALAGFIDEIFGGSRPCPGAGKASAPTREVPKRPSSYDSRLLLGPVCSYAVSSLQVVNNFLCRSPVLSVGAMSAKFARRSVEPTMEMYRYITRAGITYDAAVDLFFRAVKHFQWRKFLVAFSTDYYARPYYEYRYCNTLKSDIFNYKRHGGAPDVKIDEVDILSRPIHKQAIRDILTRKMRREIAVVVLCADPDSVREIMKTAFDLNFINGEYVFFNVDLFSNRKQTLRPWYRSNDTVEGNDKARKAYRALLTVTLRKPDSEEYKNFSRQVKELAWDRFKYAYGEEEVNSFVGAFHDAVLLYALALNETLAENQSISDGLAITRRMWNRNFTGITGNISINARGDRNADYSLLDMNKKTGDFEVVANYFGNEKKYEPVPGMQIDWGTDDPGPPLDTPVCGFDDSGCPRDQMNAGVISALVMAGLIALALVVGSFVYRRMKFLAQLQVMNWTIQWCELTTKHKNEHRRPVKKSGNRFFGIERDSSGKRKFSFPISKHENHSLLGDDRSSIKRKSTADTTKSHALYENVSLHSRSFVGSDMSLETIAGIQVNQIQAMQTFTRTAFYKGNVVALKKINLRGRRFDPRRIELLKDVKKIKDLNNDHVTRFIGACVDAPNECIITEYCPKGSLQDVLENESINLDWMFRLSLMQDVCRGMIYLHNNIGPIGNLKSSNCLVDSRFVLKITDFGLEALRGPPDLSPLEEPYRYYRNLLWTAPEHLRQISDDRPDSKPPATIKGDVYSFAVVAQEVIMRKGVFFLGDDTQPEPRQIISRLRLEGECQPLRPVLDPDEGCTEAMVQVVLMAWDEDPFSRPDFNHIKISLKKLNKGGDSGNILDNLLSRMEQYANNLEGLVQQRTEAYLEEKKKAEDLLYSMLPKSVAGQLIRCQPVTAESYENVTIYFSDICGFTSLSAESTPIQIVQMLNDLYTLFDSIIENYDAYKVETIGDAYMVVSGLPQRNGNLHAREVARMSLAFLKNIFLFRIRHKPETQLKLRIGLHSGPVCAGVVGLKMPRYCLFGDTVNTTSRMESTGLPLKIHISEATKNVLDTFDSFIISRRGLVEMKGKGNQLTFWLHGENGEIVDPMTKA